eukprot:GHVO01005703.1.p1 GENE.GHVO01005703.1~~GHVO01005703.1.p1  ORF type:complete len:316 (+),score=57.67 GHVO01005703.1:43-948(+)
MGKLAIVTGSNTGIGFFVVNRLMKWDDIDRVILCSRDAVKGEDALTKLGHNPKVTLMIVDVTNRESVIAFRDQVIKEYPTGVDILVNNAGVAIRDKSQTIGEVTKKTFAVNYTGIRVVFDAFLDHLNKGARVVHVASFMGIWALRQKGSDIRAKFVDEDITLTKLDALCDEYIEACMDATAEAKGWPSTPYAVSKAAVLALTHIHGQMAAAKDPSILVNAACPGYCKTNMAGQSLPPKTAEQGASTIITLCTLPKSSNANGEFFQEDQKIDWRSPLTFSLGMRIVWRQIVASWDQPHKRPV